MCFKSSLKQSSLSCSLDYHNDDFFGLALNDRVKMFQEQKSKFKKANVREQKKNTAHIAKLYKRYQKDMEDSD